MIINKIKKQDLIKLFNFERDYLNDKDQNPFLFENSIFEVLDYKIINVSQSKLEYLKKHIDNLKVEKETNIFLNGLKNQLDLNNEFSEDLFYEVQQKQHSIINLQEYKNNHFINLKEGVHLYLGSLTIKKILFILSLEGEIFISQEEKETIKERINKEGF